MILSYLFVKFFGAQKKYLIFSPSESTDVFSFEKPKTNPLIIALKLENKILFSILKTQENLEFVFGKNSQNYHLKYFYNFF